MINRQNLFYLYIVILFVAVFFTNISYNLKIYSITASLDADYGLKLHHVLSIVGVVYILNKGKIILLPKIVLVFYFICLLTTIISFYYLSLDIYIIKYIYCIYLSFLGAFIGYAVNKNQLMILLKYTAIVIIVCLWLRNIIYFDQLISYFHSQFEYRINLPTFCAGRNMEATVVALMSILFVHDKKYYSLIISNAILFTILVSSRSSAITTVTSIFLYLFINRYDITRQSLKVVTAVLSIFIILYYYIEPGFVFKIFYRFEELLTSNSSVMRLELWEGSLKSIKENVFGHGAFNAIQSLKINNVYPGFNDNVHNVYLQYFLDFGVQSFIIFIYIIYKIFRISFDTKFENVFGCILIVYFVNGFIRFSGYDAFMYLFIGLFYSTLPLQIQVKHNARIKKVII